MLEDLNELYQQAILEHSRRPRHFHPLPEATHTGAGDNPLCGDRYEVDLQIEKDRLNGASFHGVGCAVSKASGSLMCDLLPGKTQTEAKQLARIFFDVVRSGAMNAETPEQLKPLAGVHRFPARIKCALLPWETMLAALDGVKDTISTQEAV